VISAKEKVAKSLERAKADLEQALGDLEHMPSFEPGTYAFAAHALNNYLTVADATVHLLGLALQSYPDDQVRTWLDGLRHVSSLMMHTVAQLMNSSASFPKPRHARVDLALLVRRGCDYYRRIAGRKNIAIAYKAEPRVPAVQSDNVAIGAVLDNLLSNAVKFSQPGTHIRVSVATEPGRVVCSVRDEGPGLTAADYKQLFKRGVRLSAQPTAGEPSTGYGLAVAKELMDHLGGEIWCESEPGRGACFGFALPLGDRKA
jgi:signal transduction histidine kinase